MCCWYFCGVNLLTKFPCRMNKNINLLCLEVSWVLIRIFFPLKELWLPTALFIVFWIDSEMFGAFMQSWKTSVRDCSCPYCSVLSGFRNFVTNKCEGFWIGAVCWSADILWKRFSFCVIWMKKYQTLYYGYNFRVKHKTVVTDLILYTRYIDQDTAVFH